MSTPNPAPLDIWESIESFNYTIQESALEVDGKFILAKVEGPAFFPNTVSKNKVHYPLEAWENAISHTSFTSKLQDRLVYGTIGHDPDLNDNDIREGKFSHLVTRVWINEENIGMAEYLILNTGPGNILNTLLRLGSKLRVSTKAGGFFETSPNRDGSKSVLPSNFQLERIDFVTDAGYVEALPSLIESSNLVILPQEDVLMNEDKVTQILESNIQELKTEKTNTDNIISNLRVELQKVQESNYANNLILESYKAIATPASIQESYSELEQYRSIGSVQDIVEALETGEDTLDNLSKTVTDLQDKVDDKDTDSSKGSEYDELGAPSEVKDALDAALAVTSELQEYRELGSVDELKEVLTNAEAMTEAIEQQEIANICTKYGVTTEIVTGLSEKGYSLEEIENLLQSIKGSADTPPADTPPADTPPDEEDVDPETGKSKITSGIQESMSTQLLRRQSLTSKQNKVITESGRKQTNLVTRLMTIRR